MWGPARHVLRAALVLALLGVASRAHAEQPVQGEAKEVLRQQLIAAGRAADRLHLAFKLDAYKLGTVTKALRVEYWREGVVFGVLMTPEAVPGVEPDPESPTRMGWFTDGEVYVMKVDADVQVMPGILVMDRLLRPYRDGKGLLEALCGLPRTELDKPQASVATGAFPEGDDIVLGFKFEITHKEPRMLGREFWDTSVVVLEPAQKTVVVRGAGVEAHIRVEDASLLRWRAETAGAKKRVTIDPAPPAITVEAWRELVRTTCAAHAADPMKAHEANPMKVGSFAEWRDFARKLLVKPIADAPPGALASDEARAKAARILADAEIAATDRRDLLMGDITGTLTEARSALEQIVRSACTHASWPQAAIDALAGHLTREWGLALERAIASLWAPAPHTTDEPAK